MVDFVDELPDEQIVVAPKGKSYRIAPGKGFRCACKSCTILRNGDKYDVTGPAYHHRDSASEALVCSRCGDRFVIHPTVNYTDANMKGVV